MKPRLDEILMKLVNPNEFYTVGAAKADINAYIAEVIGADLDPVELYGPYLPISQADTIAKAVNLTKGEQRKRAGL